MYRYLTVALVCVVGWGATPAVGTVTPNSGSGSAQSFTSTYTDADGATDIAFAYLVINATFSTTSSCAIIVNSSNQFILTDDAGSFQTPISPGSGSTTNSRCTLTGAGSTINRTSNTLTVVANVTFKGLHAGAKDLILYAADGTTNSGSSDQGDWTVSFVAGTYYIDATGGSDANNGTSTGTAWQTFANVRNGTFVPGDYILLKKGEVFRDYMIIPSSGSSGSPITIGAYGSGADPIIDGANSYTSGWTLDSSNVYYRTWTFSSNAVFQTISSTKTWLLKAASRVAMNSAAGTFFYDSGASRLYIRLTTSGDPNSSTTIEPTLYRASSSSLLGQLSARNKSYINVQNIQFRNGDYYGFHLQEGGNIKVQYNTFSYIYQNNVQVEGGLGFANPTNAVATHNTFTNSGGRFHMQQSGSVAECVAINFQGVQTGTISYNTSDNQGGDVFQAMGGATNIEMAYNTVTAPYGVGVYVLGGWGNGGHTDGVEIHHNYVAQDAHTVSQGYALNVENADNYNPGSGIICPCHIKNVAFHHNVYVGTGSNNLGGLLFGSAQNNGTIENARIINNTFYNDFYGVLAKGPSSGAQYFHNNVFSVIAGSGGGVAYSVIDTNRANYNLGWDDMYGPNAATRIIEWGAAPGTFFTLAGFQGTISKGFGSTVSNPNFVSAGSNFNLTAGSPAIDTGLSFDGYRQERNNRLQDMGAYEYTRGKLTTNVVSTLRTRHRARLYP